MRKKVLVYVCLFFLVVPLFAATEVNLAEKAAEAGINLFWDPLSQNCILEKDGHQISFQSGGSYILKDYKSIEQQSAPELKSGKLVANVSFLKQMEHYFSVQQNESRSSATKLTIPEKKEKSDTAELREAYSIGAILIDPGHGGKDPGASASYTINGKKVSVVEKDINLKIGLNLYEMLKKAYPHKNIMMTRKTDKYLTLAQRTDIANSVKLASNEAVLYVSIHVNASLDKSADGFEVWYLSPGYRRQVIDSKTSDDKALLSILNSMMEEEFTTESILMAKFIEDGINAQVGSLSPQRGIKEEEWFVVRNAKMPSVLVETGFLSNEKEAALLSDNGYLQKLALGIYNGLQAFIIHFERSRGFTGN